MAITKRDRMMTLSILFTLIAVSLAAPQSSDCSPTDLNCTIDLGTQSVNPNEVTSAPGAADKDHCVCVQYFLCTEYDINTEGIGIIDIRFRGNTSSNTEADGLRSTCGTYLKHCCKPPNVVERGQRITPAPLVRKGCGNRNPTGVGFRITGHTDEAQYGEFPWMVAILRAEVNGTNAGKSNVQPCGGALIHPRAVLTAAHCVNGKQPSQFKIRAGEWDTQTDLELFPHQDRDVEHVVVHEKFHSGALYNDIAILILKTPVDYAENVDVVCLPSQDEIFDESRCLASGWGKDKFGLHGQYQMILKKLELPVVSHDSCQTALRKTRLGIHFVLNPSFICAGGEAGKDTCKGDGGSPLVCPLKSDPSRYVQAGIVAWGIGCGENQVPGVYANVASLRQWIDEQMVNHKLDTKVYQA